MGKLLNFISNYHNSTKRDFFGRMEDEKKDIGDFFMPITVRPLTILGMNYKFPNIK